MSRADDDGRVRPGRPRRYTGAVGMLTALIEVGLDYALTPGQGAADLVADRVRVLATAPGSITVEVLETATAGPPGSPLAVGTQRVVRPRSLACPWSEWPAEVEHRKTTQQASAERVHEKWRVAEIRRRAEARTRPPVMSLEHVGPSCSGAKAEDARTADSGADRIFAGLRVAPGEVYQVPMRLGRVPLHRAVGTAELPAHLPWPAETRHVNLADRAIRARVYEALLIHGTATDISTWVDGALLVDLWNELELPAGARAAWQPRLDHAATR